MLKFFLLLFISALSPQVSARVTIADSFGEKIFLNEKNEQVILRGMNVSGSTKLLENNFRPFLNRQDAAISFQLLKNNLGSNIVRLTVSWEGIQPTPNLIDLQYVADIASFIQEAVKNDIYVLIDFHQDLFSRHIFSEEEKFKGNGAPYWVTPDFNDAGKCGIFCFHWAQNNLTNKTVKEAFRQFFNNQKIESKYQGTDLIFNMQDTYINMLSSFMSLLKNNLSLAEWDKVIGVDPFNEPVDGGMEELSAKEWDQEKLWPFYLKIEKSLVQKDLGELLIFAEPLVFWNNNVGLFSPRTGTGFYNGTLSNRFVFNGHYYDGKRQTPFVFKSVKPGDYLNEFDAIRNEAKRLNVAAFVSEFGAPLSLKKKRAPIPILRGIYLALDQSTPKELTSKDNKKKSQIDEAIRGNFLSSTLSYTQWHFDIYYNQHKNPFDSWNQENFSLIKNKQGEYNLPTELLERIQILSTPARIYQSVSSSGNLGAEEKNWIGIYNQATKSVELAGKNFFFTAMTGTKNGGEHRIFIPKSFGPYLLITAKNISKSQTFGELKVKAEAEDDFIFITKEGDLSNYLSWQEGLRLQIKEKQSPIFILPD